MATASKEEMASTSRVAPTINVTPLIDVLLVLLIVFMIIAPARPGQFESKIPSRPTDEVRSPPDPSVLVVTMGNDGRLTLNGTTLAADDLATKLTDLLSSRADRTVILRAPKSMPYSRVVSLVDLVKGSGAGPLGLQIDFLDA